MLIESNIISLEDINIDYRTSFINIKSCKNMIVSIKIISNDEKIQRIVRAHHIVTISFKLSFLISVRLRDNISLLIDHDFIFSFYEQIFINARFDKENKIVFYIIDVNICTVQINNITNKTVIVAKNSRLKIIQKYEKEDCYVMFIENVFLTASTLNRFQDFKS